MSKEVKETAKQRRARTSKFNYLDPHARTGNFELVAMFHGNPTPQPAPFNNLGAAIGRLRRLYTNPDLRVVKIIEHKIGERPETIHQFMRSGPREFAGKEGRFWWETYK